MSRADTMLTAIQRIQEAPLAPDGWARALPSIARALRGEGSVLLTQNAWRNTEFVVGFGLSEQTAGFAQATVSDFTFWVAIRTLPAGSVMPSSALMPDREFARTTFYNEGVRPLGAFYGLSVSPLSTPTVFRPSLHRTAAGL